MEPVFDVFLSHNAAEKAIVIELSSRLRCRGLRPWLDEWELRPGSSWLEGLEKGLKSCRSCAVLIGKAGFGVWHEKEMQAALVAQGPDYPVIPVLLPGASDRGEIGTFLSLMTWVDLRNGIDDNTGLDRLIWGITGLRPNPTCGLAHVPDGLQNPRYEIQNPKDGDLLIGPSRVTGSGPANEWAFLHYRSPNKRTFDLGGQTKSDDKGNWEIFFPEIALTPGPHELYAAGPLWRFASQPVTIYYRDIEAIRRPCAACTETTDEIEIAYELHTAFIEKTKLHKRQLIFSGKLSGRPENFESVASQAGEAIADRLAEIAPKNELAVSGSIEPDGRLLLVPGNVWASYYAFPMRTENPQYGLSGRLSFGPCLSQRSWQLVPHVDRIPTHPFGKEYRETSEYLEIRHAGYRPEFVSLEESRPRSFEIRLTPVLNSRIAVLEFPNIDPKGTIGGFSQVIARAMVDALQRRPQLSSIWPNLDAEPMNEVLNLLDVRAVEQELESVDTEMISGEGRHLKRKALDVHYIVRGSYRIITDPH